MSSSEYISVRLCVLYHSVSLPPQLLETQLYRRLQSGGDVAGWLSLLEGLLTVKEQQVWEVVVTLRVAMTTECPQVHDGGG